MRRWKSFLHNAVGILIDLRRLLLEFHILIAIMMLVTLAIIEFWHVISRVLSR
jgi:hypothetical protein